MGSFEITLEPQIVIVYDFQKDKRISVDKFSIISRVQKKLRKAEKDGIVRNIQEKWTGKTLKITWETLNTHTNMWC